MSADLVPGPMLVALVAAVATMLLRRWPRIQVAASLVGVLSYAAVVGALTWRVVFAPDAPGPVAAQMAGLDAPFGITLVADGLSLFVLAMVATVAVASLTFSVRYVDADDQRVFYHPLFHFLLLGVSGAVLTGDFFNLFVWFEVMLMASYVFVVFYGGGDQTRAAFRYVVLNVIGSALMLLAVGGLYATTGTLNMADMAQRLADPGSGVQVVPIVGLSALLLVVFALKAGMVPFQFWVPGAYRAAPLPMVAMFAGATKKVGVYAIVRCYFTVFDAAAVSVSLPGIAGDSVLDFFGPVLLLMAGASILVGGLGAVSAASIEGTLAYSSIGQVGFIVVPLAVGATASSETVRRAAIVAALVYALNHALAKSLLFMSVGAVRTRMGTSRYADLGGLAARSPVLAGAFFVGILSLVGIPPLSGFFGKFLVFETAVRTETATAVVVLLGGSLLTIVYTTRAWNRTFWGSPTAPVDPGVWDPIQLAVLVALALAIVGVGVGFEPVYEFADTAAGAVVDREGYIDAVGPTGGDGA